MDLIKSEMFKRTFAVMNDMPDYERESKAWKSDSQIAMEKLMKEARQR